MFELFLHHCINGSICSIESVIESLMVVGNHSSPSSQTSASIRPSDICFRLFFSFFKLRTSCTFFPSFSAMVVIFPCPGEKISVSVARTMAFILNTFILLGVMQSVMTGGMSMWSMLFNSSTILECISVFPPNIVISFTSSGSASTGYSFCRSISL